MNRQQMMMVEEDSIFKPFHNIQLIFFFTSPCLLQFNCNAVCQYWFCTIPACHMKEIFAQNNQNTCSDSKLQSNTCCRWDWETVAVWPKCQLQNILFFFHKTPLSSLICYWKSPIVSTALGTLVYPNADKKWKKACPRAWFLFNHRYLTSPKRAFRVDWLLKIFLNHNSLKMCWKIITCAPNSLSNFWGNFHITIILKIQIVSAPGNPNGYFFRNKGW